MAVAVKSIGVANVKMAPAVRDTDTTTDWTLTDPVAVVVSPAVSVATAVTTNVPLRSYTCATTLVPDGDTACLPPSPNSMAASRTAAPPAVTLTAKVAATPGVRLAVGMAMVMVGKSVWKFAESWAWETLCSFLKRPFHSTS